MSLTLRGARVGEVERLLRLTLALGSPTPPCSSASPSFGCFTIISWRKRTSGQPGRTWSLHSWQGVRRKTGSWPHSALSQATLDSGREPVARHPYRGAWRAVAQSTDVGPRL